MKKYLYHLSVLVILALIVTWSSCSSEFEKMAPVPTSTDSVKNGLKQQKILLLVADGARGQSVKESLSPNLTTLIKNSTSSWVSLSDEIYNRESSWTDMFTGVSKEKHGIISSDFSTNKFSDYPLVFQRIKQAKPNTRIATFAYTSSFSNNLKAGTDLSQSFGTDQQVKAAVISELANDNAELVVGLFGDINTAGATFGYDSSVPQYKASILAFDAYVGEAMTALRARKNYANENWLVIVTSSGGGNYTMPGNDGTIFSNTKVNTFTLFYNTAYQQKYIDKPFTGNRFQGSFIKFAGGTNSSSATAVRAEMKGNPEVLKLAKKEYTIELKVKKNASSSGSFVQIFPVFFGNKASKAANGPGFSFSWEGSATSNVWRFYLGRSTGANLNVAGTDIRDGNWHTLSVKVYNEAGKRYMATFTDGIYTNNRTEIPASFVEDDSPNPITIGWTSDTPQGLTNPFDGYIADIRIWLTPLPNATISQYSCDTFVSPNHPNYNALAGSWPCDDGAGNIIRDRGTLGNDFTIVLGGTTSPFVEGIPIANPVWTSLTSVICAPAASNLFGFVPNTKDITPQMLSWLGISPADTWKLDGRVWLNQ